MAYADIMEGLWSSIANTAEELRAKSPDHELLRFCTGDGLRDHKLRVEFVTRFGDGVPEDQINRNEKASEELYSRFLEALRAAASTAPTC